MLEGGRPGPPPVLIFVSGVGEGVGAAGSILSEGACPKAQRADANSSPDKIADLILTSLFALQAPPNPRARVSSSSKVYSHIRKAVNQGLPAFTSRSVGRWSMLIKQGRVPILNEPMALDVSETKFVLHARKLGVSFDQTAAIGRQNLHIAGDDLQQLLSSNGFDVTPAKVETIISGSDGYAEKLFEFLGASEVVSFDASSYENATYVHDFNKPIPDEFKNRFSCVIDGGTLEHVFNFPVALKNAMEMLKVGGHFLGLTPTNNYSGHGFYQFSPELFYQVFVPANGFEIVKVYLLEEAVTRRWFEVSDPSKVMERVVVINDDPSLLMVIAKKIAEVEIFSEAPQQSDYLAKWKADDANRAAKNGHQVERAISLLKRIQRAAGRPLGIVNRRRDHFKKIDL